MVDVNISGGFTTVMQCGVPLPAPSATDESSGAGSQDAKIQALEALVEELAARVAALEEGKVNTLR